MKQGYIHIYTGNGKGKTTCALGLALRAWGAGMRVYIGQFIKAGTTSEAKAVGQLGNRILMEQFGTDQVILDPDRIGEEEKEAAGKGLKRIKQILSEADFDLVILDEINSALSLGLLERAAVLALMEEKPPGTELVLTGRNADQLIIDHADLVTEMKEIKHYYHKGVPARIGIEQ